MRDEFNVESLSNAVTHFFHSFVIVLLVMSDALDFVVNQYCVTPVFTTKFNASDIRM